MYGHVWKIEHYDDEQNAQNLFSHLCPPYPEDLENFGQAPRFLWRKVYSFVAYLKDLACYRRATDVPSTLPDITDKSVSLWEYSKDLIVCIPRVLKVRQITRRLLGVELRQKLWCCATRAWRKNTNFNLGDNTPYLTGLKVGRRKT